MRKIKFRAWDTKSGKMLSFDELQRFDWDELPKLCYAINNEEGYIPLQFTGLKDKNGKEIYEGDLLWEDESWDLNDDDSRGYYTFQVKWDEVGFALFDLDEDSKFVPTAGDKLEDFVSGPKLDTFEVIGNIYENPQLLKP